MIKIENRKTYKGDGIYIGRKVKEFEESVLKNKYRIGVDGTRDEVIAKYRVWLWHEIWENRNGPVVDKLWELYLKWKEVGELTLICNCSPLRCHGEIVKGCLEWIDKDLQSTEGR